MMSEKKLRRFTRIEIVHHWCQAIPYIVLSGTGGMLLTCRALGIDLPSLGTAGLVHRVAGFALIGIWLQIAIVGIYSGDLRELLGSLRESISWKTRDIVWVFRVPLQIVWPGLRLPPSSRLNPGQKFHLLLTAIVIPLFTLSGLAMIFVPGALGAWILHTLLFFPALFFLGVHIFSALVNPETRKSSRSMVTGYVETELARAHHPLWVGDDSGAWENPPPPSFRRWPPPRPRFFWARAWRMAHGATVLRGSIRRHWLSSRRAVRRRFSPAISARTTPTLPRSTVARVAIAIWVRRRRLSVSNVTTPSRKG